MRSKMAHPKQQFYGHFATPSTLSTTSTNTTFALPFQADQNEEPLDLRTKANNSQYAVKPSKVLNKSNPLKTKTDSQSSFTKAPKCPLQVRRPKRQSALNATQLIAFECLNGEASSESPTKYPDIFKGKFELPTHETATNHLANVNEHIHTVPNESPKSESECWSEEQQQPRQGTVVHALSSVRIQETDGSRRLAGERGRKLAGRQFNCDLCSGSFRTRQNVIRHRNEVHLMMRPHRCRQCGKTFKRTEGLLYHQQSVHLRTNRVCCIFPNCGITFDHKQKLKRHLREIHLQLRPFSCPQCITTFKRKEGLNNHQLAYAHY